MSNLRRKLGLGENGLPEIRSIRGAGYVLIAGEAGEARDRRARIPMRTLFLRIFLSFWAAMLLVLSTMALVAWYRFNQVQSVSIDIKALANEASQRLLVGGLPALHDWIEEAEQKDATDASSSSIRAARTSPSASCRRRYRAYVQPSARCRLPRQGPRAESTRRSTAADAVVHGS